MEPHGLAGEKKIAQKIPLQDRVCCVDEGNRPIVAAAGDPRLGLRARDAAGPRDRPRRGNRADFFSFVVCKLTRGLMVEECSVWTSRFETPFLWHLRKRPRVS